MKKILFVASEAVPFIKTGGLADVVGSLPKYLDKRYFDARVILPKYMCMKEEIRNSLEYIGDFYIDYAGSSKYVGVLKKEVEGVIFYFIDNEDYFQKRSAMTKDELGNDYPDNGERAIFFARGVLETVKKLRWAPDIIHCQGWMASVIPFYVKTAYHDEPQFANSKVVTSLFSEQPQDSLGVNFKKSLEFREAKAESLKKYGDNFDFMELGKLAIDYSDGVISTSEGVNAALIDYAKNNEKQLLEHIANDTELKGKYSDFYNNLI